MNRELLMALFSCVAANYLGLVEAIEKNIGRKIPIVNCSRCFSFWSVLILSLVSSKQILLSIAVAFLCATLAPWVELFMGLLDTYYNRLYDKIYSSAETDKKGTP